MKKLCATGQDVVFMCLERYILNRKQGNPVVKNYSNLLNQSFFKKPVDKMNSREYNRSISKLMSRKSSSGRTSKRAVGGAITAGEPKVNGPVRVP